MPDDRESTIHVVMAEAGEYEEREVWIVGASLDPGEADGMMAAALRDAEASAGRRMAWDLAYEVEVGEPGGAAKVAASARSMHECYPNNPTYRRLHLPPVNQEAVAEYDAWRARRDAFYAARGECPALERIDRCWVAAVPLGVRGVFGGDDT